MISDLSGGLLFFWFFFQISLIVKRFNIQDDLGPLRWSPLLLVLLCGRLFFSVFFAIWAAISTLSESSSESESSMPPRSSESESSALASAFAATTGVSLTVRPSIVGNLDWASALKVWMWL